MYEAKITDFNLAVLNEVHRLSVEMDFDMEHDEAVIYITNLDKPNLLKALDGVTNKTKATFNVEIVEWVEIRDGFYESKDHSQHEFFPDVEVVA